MTTSSVGAVGGAASATTASKSGLDRDAFLKLLITQLRNQDPLKPVEDKEFIAQLAQFSSLEQMQSINKGLEQLIQAQSALPQGLALIGRTVQAVTIDGVYDPKLGTNVLTGKVEGLDFSSGRPVLKIGGKLVPMENLISVS